MGTALLPAAVTRGLRVEVVADAGVKPDFRGCSTVRLTDDVGQLLIGVRSTVRAGVTGRGIITTVAETVVAFLLDVAVILTAAATGTGSYAGFEFLNRESHQKPPTEEVVVGRLVANLKQLARRVTEKSWLAANPRKNARKPTIAPQPPLQVANTGWARR